MADLLVLGFDREDSAEAVRTLTAELMKEHLIELEDAVVVVRTQDGKVKIHQRCSIRPSPGLPAEPCGAALWAYCF